MPVPRSFHAFDCSMTNSFARVWCTVVSSSSPVVVSCSVRFSFLSLSSSPVSAPPPASASRLLNEGCSSLPSSSPLSTAPFGEPFFFLSCDELADPSGVSERVFGKGEPKRAALTLLKAPKPPPCICRLEETGFSLLSALETGLGTVKGDGELDLYVNVDVNLLLTAAGDADVNGDVLEGDAHAENPLGLFSPDVADDVQGDAFVAPNDEPADLESAQIEGSAALSCMGFVENAEKPKPILACKASI